MTEMDKLYEREDIYDVRTVEELAGHYKTDTRTVGGKILRGKGC